LRGRAHESNVQQRKFYENTLRVTKKEISDLEANIQEELAKVKERLAELQNGQKAARQMYAAACLRLGIQNDLEESEEKALADLSCPRPAPS
jgi:hypothetical protein